MTRFIFCALALWLTVFTGCVANEDRKLGGDGETCFVDEDCRFGYLCNDGVCLDEFPDSFNNGFVGENNTSNNAEPNNDSNNASCGDGVCSPGETDTNCVLDCDGPDTINCEAACQQLDACLSEDPESCLLGCRREVESLDEESGEIFLSCIINATCAELRNGDIEECFEEAFNP